MNSEDHQDIFYDVTLGINDVRVLHYAISEAIKNWPGAPARPAEEQQYLWQARDWTKKIILEHTFNIM
tara:strand:+ start:230 stop:433 length:204 start_codon:yes stop_codon:yes gene_type:complete